MKADLETPTPSAKETKDVTVEAKEVKVETKELEQKPEVTESPNVEVTKEA